MTRSQTGRVITDTVNGANTSSFVYDTAGRLTQATQPGHVLQYQYGTQTGCTGSNLLANAGANTNRTALIDNAVTVATYCYDTADRLVGTTQTGYGAGIVYDDHGNTTALAGETLGYDGADRHVTTTAGAVTVTYVRDVTDRIVSRTVPAAGAVPVFRGAGTAASNASGSTTLAVARPAAAVAGDVLLATVATVGATVTAPPGWTVVGSTSNTGVRTIMLWRLATSSDPSSWTFTLSASQKAAGRMVAYSGVHQTLPIDVTATAATVSSTSHPAPLVTTTEANRLVLTVASVAVRTSFTPAVSTTERVDVSANTGAPTVTVELAEHAQTVEGLSTLRTPVSALAALGATMTVALRPANSGTTKTLRYSYSGGADATALTLTNTNAILDRTISLPGGVVVTRQTGTVSTWAYPNIHGDITYTIDHTGTKTGPFPYDPYGQPLTGISNTSPGDMDGGWLGQHQRPTEHQPELKPTIEMGARPYRPDLGRFLRIDPIDGGATHSNYAYPIDPVNQYDLTGEAACHMWDEANKTIKKWTVMSGLATISGSLTVRLKCGTPGEKGSGVRHLRNSTHGRNHIKDWDMGLKKRFGIGISEDGFIAAIGHTIKTGAQTLSGQNQITFDAWIPVYGHGALTGQCREYHMVVFVNAGLMTVTSAFINRARSCR